MKLLNKLSKQKILLGKALGWDFWLKIYFEVLFFLVGILTLSGVGCKWRRTMSLAFSGRFVASAFINSSFEWVGKTDDKVRHAVVWITSIRKSSFVVIEQESIVLSLLTTESRKSMACCNRGSVAQNIRKSSLPMGSFSHILSYSWGTREGRERRNL